MIHLKFLRVVPSLTPGGRFAGRAPDTSRANIFTLIRRRPRSGGGRPLGCKNRESGFSPLFSNNVTSASGQNRPFGSRPDTSSLPDYPDIFSSSWPVSNVPTTDVAVAHR